MTRAGRAAPGFGSNDIRSTAILQDYLFETDPCTPGVEIHTKCGRTYISESGSPPCGFDRPKYMIMAIMAMFIVFIVIGVLNCFGIYIPSTIAAYGMGYVELCFIAGLTYAVMIKISCVGCCLIAYFGHRLTALTGMVMVCIALILDAFVIHPVVFYLAYILLYGIGGGLAYASAISVAGDLFRKHLSTAMLMVSIATCLGTITFYWISLMLLKFTTYRWTKMCIALFVLLFTGATHLFPNFMVDIEYGFERSHKKDRSKRNKHIRDVAKEAAAEDKMENPSDNPTEQTCICVCVCDVNLWRDWSFVLWGVCILLATMALYVPYMFIIAYADTIYIMLSPWYITALCLTSIAGRLTVILGVDFTFSWNRILFITGVLISGVLYICLPYITTFGWLIVWCAIMGLAEGIIIAVIPRVTLLTIPKEWMESSWSWILWFHAIGVFLITIFVALMGHLHLNFLVAFTTIGILQIIGAIMAILLPNEDDCENHDDCNELLPALPLPEEHRQEPNYNYRYHRRSTLVHYQSGRRSGGGGGGGGRDGRHSSIRDVRRSSLHGGGAVRGSSLNGGGGGSSLHGGRERSGAGGVGFYNPSGNSIRPGSSSIPHYHGLHDIQDDLRGGMGGSVPEGSSYACECPICKKAGCMSECPGCVPASLPSDNSPGASTKDNPSSKNAAPSVPSISQQHSPPSKSSSDEHRATKDLVHPASPSTDILNTPPSKASIRSTPSSAAKQPPSVSGSNTYYRANPTVSSPQSSTNIPRKPSKIPRSDSGTRHTNFDITKTTQTPSK